MRILGMLLRMLLSLVSRQMVRVLEAQATRLAAEVLVRMLFAEVLEQLLQMLGRQADLGRRRLAATVGGLLATPLAAGWP